MARQIPRQAASGIFQTEAARWKTFVISFLVDAANGALVLIMLFVFSWLLELGKASGLNENHINVIEQADFWMNFSVFVIIGISFIFRLLLTAFRLDS